MCGNKSSLLLVSGYILHGSVRQQNVNTIELQFIHTANWLTNPTVQCNLHLPNCFRFHFMLTFIDLGRFSSWQPGKKTLKVILRSTAATNNDGGAASTAYTGPPLAVQLAHISRHTAYAAVAVGDVNVFTPWGVQG